MKKKIVFLLDSISQPRCIKRIKSFINYGFEIEIYGIDRNKYNVNAKIDNFKINIIGQQMQGRGYFAKFIINHKEIKKLLKKYRNSNVIYYCFGFPLTFSLFFNGGKNYVYEIADILYGYKKFDKLRWLIKKIDLLLIKNSYLTILTSEGFSNFLFNHYYPTNVLVQPNKIDSSFLNSQRPPGNSAVNTANFIFSFIGGFRSPNTIFRFAKIIGENYPKHQFHFYGDSSLTKNVIKLSETYENVTYFGAFRNPEDLQNIYINTDLVVACYDTSEFNERLLEPNKLYEALYFKKPIIVSSDTFLSERVSELGCGFSIEASNDASIISFIDSLNAEQIEKIETNIKKVNIEEIIDDNSAKIISYLENHIK